MKRLRALGFGATLLLGACTHTQVLSRAAPPEAFAEANTETIGREAEILTREGQLFRWYDVLLAPDSTSALLLASGSGTQPRIPTDQLVQVTLRSRTRGAWEGALIGAGIGAVLGFIIGPDEHCDEYVDPFCADSRGEQAAWGMASGALWGVIIGAIRASRTRIQLR